MYEQMTDYTPNIADMFPDPIAILDMKGTILWCNEATYKISQLSSDEIIGKRFTELTTLNANDVPKYVKLFASIISGKTVDPFEFRWHRKDGAAIDSEASIDLILQPDGTKTIQVITRSISKQKIAENAALREQKIAQQYIDVAGVALVALDTTGKIMMMNQFAKKMLGVTNDEILRKNWFDEFIPEEVQDTTGVLFEKLVKDGSSTDVHFHENIVQAKDGTRKLIKWVNTPLKDEKGQIIGTLSSGEDITGIRAKEHQLHENEEKWRSILQTSPDPLTYLDTDLNIQYINRSASGIPVDELKGKYIIDYLPNNEAEHVKEILLKIISSKQSASYESTFYPLDGDPIYFDNLAVPRIVNDKCVGVVITSHDSTHRSIAEKILAERERKFRSIFEQAAIGVARVRPNGIMIETNTKLEQLLGYEKGELNGVNVFDITTEEDSEIEKTLSTELISGKRDSYSMEKRFFRKDGTLIWGRLTVSVSRDELGKIEFTIGMLEDITETKLLQEALEVSERKFRSIVDNAGVGITLVSPDDYILEANQKYQELIGYSLEELRSMTIADFTHPEDAEIDRLHTEEIMIGLRDNYQMEKRYITEDGRIIWINLTVSGIRNDEGEVYLFIGIIENITQRKHVEAALLESERRFRNLIEQLPLGLVITDMSGQIRFVNNTFASILAQDKTEIVGMDLAEYVDSNQLKDTQGGFADWKQGDYSTYEVDLSRIDGKSRNIRIFSAPDFGAFDDIVGSLMIVEDISDQKKYKAIRLQQEKEISLYSKLLRHDIINDLGLILSYIESVQMLIENPTKEVITWLNSALATIERTTTLLRTFGNPQEVREIDIVEFIQEIANEAQETEEKLQISVMYINGANNIRIAAGGLISLVFMNLFRNAAQHAGESPVVQVKVTQSEKQIIITVSDNGPGVSKEFQKRLFSRGVSSKGECGGLGLHLCRQIIESTGGSIELQENKKGATFELILPMN